MTDLVIRDIDAAAQAKLETLAAGNARSVEAEARALLLHALAPGADRQEHIADLARRLFGPEHGVDLALPPRSQEPDRPMPDFAPHAWP